MTGHSSSERNASSYTFEIRVIPQFLLSNTLILPLLQSSFFVCGYEENKLLISLSAPA